MSDLSIQTGQERFEGYRRALAAAGLPLEPSLAVFGKSVEREGYRLVRQLFERATTPTALFTGSKLLTLGALRYLYEHAIAVPEGVVLASFDPLDWLPNSPEMLSVEQPAYEIGAKAAELLLARMKAPERPTELVVLPSTVTWAGRRTPQTQTSETQAPKARAP